MQIWEKMNVPAPAPLQLGEKQEEAFRTFKLQWGYYALATGITAKPAATQVAILMSILGAEAMLLVEDLELTDAEKTSTVAILDKLEQKITPKREKRTERSEFHNMVQHLDESLDDYVKRLKLKVQHCKYGDDEKEYELKEQFVKGILDRNLRKELLRDEALSLNDMVEKCKEEKRIEDLSLAYDRLHVGSNVGEGTSGAALKVTLTRKKDGKCYFCGGSHSRRKEDCPAFGKKCNGCGKMNHFRKVCRNKSKKPMKKKRNSAVRKVEEEISSSGSEDSDAEELNIVDIFCVEKHVKLEKARIFVTLEVGAGYTKKLNCQADTGASVNIISLKDLQRVVPEPVINPTEVKLRCFGGQLIEPIGATQLAIKLKNKKEVLEFIVVRIKQKPLLSAEACVQLGVIKIQNVDEVKVLRMSCEEIVNEYSDVFEGDGCFDGEFKIEIDEMVKPVQQKARRIPVAYNDELRDKIEELASRGIIEPVNKHMEWISNLVLVKRGKKLRLCLDPAELNTTIKRARHQIPTIEEMLPDLQNAKVFSVLDAQNGFWHMKLDSASSDLTAFWTPQGTFKWNRMPFGISAAPEMFQKAQQQLIAGLKGIRCLADDMLIFGCGKTKAEALEDHNNNLRAALQRFRQRGLRINRTKMKLALSEVPFFGHVLTEHGVKPDPMKVKAILDIPTPTNKKELHTFLGLATYLGKFLPSLSDVCAPLRRILKQDADFTWDEDAEAAFQKLKHLAISTPVLGYFDTSEELVIQCDASKSGIGCVLLQRDKPVVYGSRTLTKTESGYACIERECLAIVFACKRFEQYVAGKSGVIVETDHKPLVEIFRKPIHTAPIRLQRMMMALKRYDIVVQYRKGSQMYIADLLSRTAVENTSEGNDDNSMVFQLKATEKLFKRFAEVNVVEYSDITDERFAEIADETKKDPLLRKLLDVLAVGWPDRKNELQDELMMYSPVKDELSVIGGVIFKGDRVLVPKSLRQKLVQRLHRAHQGIEYTLRSARATMYWPGMADQITNVVRNCEACMEYSASQLSPPMTTHEIPLYPFQRVHLDLCEVNMEGVKTTMLITADSYSDFIEVDILKGTTTAAIVECCKRNFARHGIPEVVVTDNGPQFHNAAFEKFSKTWEFLHSTSSPYHQSGNGKAESAVKQVKRIYKKARRTGEDFWQAILQHRNTPNKLGTSPAQRLLGRSTRNSIPLKTSKMRVAVSQKALSQVPDQIAKHREKTKKYYDRGTRRLTELKVGDNVVFQRRPDTDKRWEKATVIGKLPDKSVELQTAEGSTMRRSGVHVKPFGGATGFPRVGPDSSNLSREDLNTDEDPGSDPGRVFEKRSYPKTPGRIREDSIGNGPNEMTAESTNEKSMRGQMDRPKREIRRPKHLDDFAL